MTLEVSVLVRSVEAWWPFGDMFLIEINSPSDRQLAMIYRYNSIATHARSLAHRLNEVFMDLVKGYLVHMFHSKLSSKQLCHSWQTTRLKGQWVPLCTHNIFQLRICEALMWRGLLRTSYGFQVTSRLKSLTELQSAQLPWAKIETEWSKSKLCVSL